MARTPEERLKALYEKRQSLDAQIQKIEEEKAQELRKRQQKREQLIGRVIYDMVKSGEWTEETLIALIDSHLVRTADRKLFGLKAKKKDVDKLDHQAHESAVESGDTPDQSVKHDHASQATSKPHRLPEPAQQSQLEDVFNL